MKLANKKIFYLFLRIIFSIRFWLFVLGGGLVLYSLKTDGDVALQDYRLKSGLYYILAAFVLTISIKMSKIIFKAEYYNYEEESDIQSIGIDDLDFSARPYMCVAGIDLKETTYYMVVILAKIIIFPIIAFLSVSVYAFEPLPSYAQPEMLQTHFKQPIQQICSIAMKMKPNKFPEISESQRQLFRSYPHIQEIVITTDEGCGYVAYKRDYHRDIVRSYSHSISSPDQLNEMFIIYFEGAGSQKWRGIYVPGVVDRPSLSNVKYHLYVDVARYN